MCVWSGGEMRGVRSTAWHTRCCSFGLAQPLRVCTRLLKVWPYGPGMGWDGGLDERCVCVSGECWRGHEKNHLGFERIFVGSKPK